MRQTDGQGIRTKGRVTTFLNAPTFVDGIILLFLTMLNIFDKILRCGLSTVLFTRQCCIAYSATGTFTRRTRP